MSSSKCAQCGLINFATDSTCKRCHAPLNQNLPQVASTGPQGIVLEDGYVLPPPPTVGMAGSGVWRHGSTLVMSKDALLPYRCVKCNVATDRRLKRRLTWHHPAIYILIFVALLIYLIVALIVRKTATLEIGLCEEHLAKRRRNVWISWLLVVSGLAGLVLGVMQEDGTFLIAGFVLLIAAIIYAVVAVRIVAPSRIDDRFVWLRGINKDYLNELPTWPGY